MGTWCQFISYVFIRFPWVIEYGRRVVTRPALLMEKSCLYFRFINSGDHFQPARNVQQVINRINDVMLYINILQLNICCVNPVYCELPLLLAITLQRRREYPLLSIANSVISSAHLWTTSKHWAENSRHLATSSATSIITKTYVFGAINQDNLYM